MLFFFTHSTSSLRKVAKFGSRENLRRTLKHHALNDVIVSRFVKLHCLGHAYLQYVCSRLLDVLIVKVKDNIWNWSCFCTTVSCRSCLVMSSIDWDLMRSTALIFLHSGARTSLLISYTTVASTTVNRNLDTLLCEARHLFSLSINFMKPKSSWRTKE